MDPLSITASAVAVIQAAGFTTKTVFNFVQSIRTADSRVSSLSDELLGLQRHLDAVQKTLEECRSREFAPVHSELWQRCDEALKDCLITLTLLEVWISKIKDEMPSKGKSLRWRTKTVVDLSTHGNEIVAFREKIQKSSIALQTMLHAITVSISLKSHASQDKILFELEQLKYSFKEALRLSLRPAGSRTPCQSDNADARVSRNLHKLAAAARQFHSTASSTSGTTVTGSNESMHAMSLIGDFPEHTQQRVEQYINHQLRYAMPVPTISVMPDQEVIPRPHSPLHTTTPSPNSENPTVGKSATASGTADAEFDDIDDDEAEDEQEYYDGLEELARDQIVNGNYTKAIEFITQAMTRNPGTKSPGTEARGLRIQLALCHFLQGGWKKAEPIVTSLSNSMDETTCNLHHALALCCLAEYSFDEALKACRKSLIGKKKLLRSSQAGGNDYSEFDYAETVALRAMIHHMSGDPIHAEIYHRKLPQGFQYKHPRDAIDFILENPRLMSTALGQSNSVGTSRMAGQPGGLHDFSSVGSSASPFIDQFSVGLFRKATVSESPLKTSFAFFERYENDTDKIVVVEQSPSSPVDSAIDLDADDEISPVLEPSEKTAPPLEPNSIPSPQLRRRLTRYFTSKRPRHRQADDSAAACASSPPEETVASPSKWSKFGLIKSKSLLRRKPSNNASEASPSMTKTRRTLRLGNVEVTIGGTVFTAGLPPVIPQCEDLVQTPPAELPSLSTMAGDMSHRTTLDRQEPSSGCGLDDQGFSTLVTGTPAGREKVKQLRCAIEAQRKTPTLKIHTTSGRPHTPTDVAALLSRAAAAVCSLAHVTDSYARWTVRCELELILKFLESGISNDSLVICDLRRIVASLDNSAESVLSDAASDSGYETRSPHQKTPQTPVPRPVEQQSSPLVVRSGAFRAPQPLSSVHSPTKGAPLVRGAVSHPTLQRAMPSFFMGDDARFNAREAPGSREQSDSLHCLGSDIGGSPPAKTKGQGASPGGRGGGDSGLGDDGDGGVEAGLSRALSFIEGKEDSIEGRSKLLISSPKACSANDGQNNERERAGKDLRNA